MISLFFSDIEPDAMTTRVESPNSIVLFWIFDANEKTKKAKTTPSKTYEKILPTSLHAFFDLLCFSFSSSIALSINSMSSLPEDTESILDL